MSFPEKTATVGHFLAAALVPRKVIVEKGFHRTIMNAGTLCRGTSLSEDNYNHSLARLVGCLLLEHNRFKTISVEVRNKIGGASPLTATRLTGKAA